MRLYFQDGIPDVKNLNAVVVDNDTVPEEFMKNKGQKRDDSLTFSFKMFVFPQGRVGGVRPLSSPLFHFFCYKFPKLKIFFFEGVDGWVLQE